MAYPVSPRMRKTGWRWASATNASSGEDGFASKYGRMIEISVTYCFKRGAASAGPRSIMATVSDRRPRLSVTSPAAQALRTQATSP